MLIRRLARPLLASTFVANGVETLMHPQSRVQEASNLVVKGQETLPSNIASSLPSDPDTLVKVTAAVQIAGGTLLALGKAPPAPPRGPAARRGEGRHRRSSLRGVTIELSSTSWYVSQ
ncbi:DoxX family membrane protein [Nocardia carnea]|uniref:DoxX family membrane protein n=1 Tax=Nocardia carnea TaxID=37328 RepID=UPI00245395BE|nr:DoxX family membrane protein [Nocardia carnea]